MNDTALIALILILAPMAFVGFWCAVIWMIAVTSGWRRLAGAFAVPRPIPDSARGGVSGMVGWAGYNHVLRVAHNDRYLFLDVMWLFRVGHPALRIPWSAITVGAEAGWFFKRVVPLTITHPISATLRLPAVVLPAARR
jgi:hypothetical protein